MISLILLVLVLGLLELTQQLPLTFYRQPHRYLVFGGLDQKLETLQSFCGWLFARSLGVEILIDDNPRYALECAEHGIEVLLFDLHGSYPWSKTAQGPTHPLITRVNDWSEVANYLQGRHYT